MQPGNGSCFRGREMPVGMYKMHALGHKCSTVFALVTLTTINQFAHTMEIVNLTNIWTSLWTVGEDCSISDLILATLNFYCTSAVVSTWLKMDIEKRLVWMGVGWSSQFSNGHQLCCFLTPWSVLQVPTSTWLQTTNKCALIQCHSGPEVPMYNAVVH